MKINTRRVALKAAAVAAVATTGLAVAGPAAFAATLGGAATIINPSTNQPMTSGGSTTAFSISLPPQAACSGDTAGKQYHVWGFMVPPPAAGQTLDQEMAGVAWNGPTFNYYNLYDTTGLQYGPANTASGTGQIIGIPSFSFQGTNANGQPILQPAGKTTVYEVGIACTDASTKTSDYWFQTVTFNPSTADANGFTWTTQSSTAAPEVPVAVAIPVAGAALLGTGFMISRRRRNAGAIA